MSAPGRREGGLVLRSLRRREELGPRKATPRGDGEVAEPGVRTSEVWEPERIAGLRGFFSSPSFLYGHMRNRVDAPSLCVRNHLRPAPSSTPSGCGRRWAEVGGWAGWWGFPHHSNARPSDGGHRVATSHRARSCSITRQSRGDAGVGGRRVAHALAWRQTERSNCCGPAGGYYVSVPAAGTAMNEVGPGPPSPAPPTVPPSTSAPCGSEPHSLSAACGGGGRGGCVGVC